MCSEYKWYTKLFQLLPAGAPKHKWTTKPFPLLPIAAWSVKVQGEMLSSNTVYLWKQDNHHQMSKMKWAQCDFLFSFTEVDFNYIAYKYWWVTKEQNCNHRLLARTVEEHIKQYTD